MTRGPIRRAQLIAPFGVGAMVIVQDGTSLICCGLDHWHESEIPGKDVDLGEYKIQEWRLQRLLKVDHFRLPPDYREDKYGEKAQNSLITVPFLRFPQWHYCTTCGYLQEQPLSLKGRSKCSKCEAKGKKRYLVQVPYVAMCERGHLQDFPWREWVHYSAKPDCQKDMRLVATGGATLAALKVKCDCGDERSLSKITVASPDGKETELSKSLNKNKELYLCQGKLPWHGANFHEPCQMPLRGTLRSASNVYYAQVKSGIHLPVKKDGEDLSDLISLLQRPPISTLISLLTSSGVEVQPVKLKELYSDLLREYPNTQISEALKVLLSGEIQINSRNTNVQESDPEVTLRREEYNILTEEQNEDNLCVKSISIENYRPDINNFFSKITLVEKLMETRVLTGFNRVFPENALSFDHHKKLMWRNIPSIENSWLPAYIVYGEGIFVEFNEVKLREWMKSNEMVFDRINPLVERYTRIQEERQLKLRPLGPRFILIHTFAHLFMNRLIFECGYSSSSLRERLYISDNAEAPMAGVLIYTAAGDSEGTMGGLVRMGKPGYFEAVFDRALENAKWCSADPICMEIGDHGGQGPDSCNLAACHNCSLIPETACEEFNRFLDRAIVIGTISNSNMGYFNFHNKG